MLIIHLTPGCLENDMKRAFDFEIFALFQEEIKLPYFSAIPVVHAVKCRGIDIRVWSVSGV